MNSVEKERGAFLRRIRELTSPEALGITQGSRRRTPGLKREEVAEWAGISSTWYTWIEQGRTVHVSDKVLSKLADLLGMSEAQRNYLF